MVDKMKYNWKQNRKRIYIGISILLIVAMVLLTVITTLAMQNGSLLTIRQTTKNITTKIASDYEADKIYLPGEAPTFRTSAKFKILEIVPYRGMAEIGYGIAGEEPVDITKISKQDFNNDLFQVLHTSTEILEWVGTDSEGYLTNKNLFITSTLKEGLELTNAQVQSFIENKSVDVLVVEAEALNKNPSLIEQADYIYIHNNFYNGSGNVYFTRLMKLYETYSYEALMNPSMTKYSTTGTLPEFSGNGNVATDLTLEVVAKLFYYAVIDQMPLTFSGYTAKEEASGTTNNQKLGYAITIAEMLDTLGVKSKSDIYYELFVAEHEQSWSFWNIKSMIKYLLPTATNSELDHLVATIQNAFSSAVDNDFVGDYTYTTTCALAHGSGQECSVLSKLGSGDTYAGKVTITDEEDWCKDVNNNTRDIAINIRNSLKPTFHLLEIQPDNKFSLDTSKISKWIPKRTRVKIQITQMTMSEFVGIIADLNSEFDMIYFGNNVNRMLGNQYYYSGIMAASSTLKAAQGENITGSNFLYSGNDISNLMMEKVEDFMDAGFPVAYESVLNDASRTSPDTNMYQFVHNHATNMYQVVNATTISGGSTNGYLDANDIDLGKPELFHTLGSGIEEYEEGTTVSVGQGGLNNLEFNTKYGTGTYRAYLYVDQDSNGIFNRWNYNGGSYSLDSNYELPIWQATFQGTEKVNVSGATIPATAMLGTIHWKLEVVKLNGGSITGIRTNLTGHLKCNHASKVVKVLQLSDLTSYPEMDFTSSSNEACSFRAKANSSIVSSNFTIQVTAKDLFNFDSSELNVLNYDVIIVGFVNPNKKLIDADTLLNKLSIAATKGKGIIFTQDALTYFNDATDPDHWGTNINHRIRTLLGMDRYRAYSSGSTTVNAAEMAFTYNVLNKYSNDKYFSGLENDIPVTDYVKRINDAKITRYPYVIKVDASGFSTKSGVYQVDADQNGLPVQTGVGYFCLSDGPNELNYSVSPNDIRNNYYLWRNDTVFYSGITRESFSGNGSSLNNETEVELFINTIISSFGLERSVNLEVTNLHQLSDYEYGKQYILYGDFDFDEEDISGSKEVQFHLSVVGMNNPTVEIRFYQADADGNIVSDALTMTRSGSTFETSSDGSGTDVFQVAQDTEYSFLYPYSFLANGANENIVMEATANEAGKTTTDFVLIKAIRRSMFDLD